MCHSHAVRPIGAGSWVQGERLDLAVLWRAVSCGRGGHAGGPGAHGRHRHGGFGLGMGFGPGGPRGRGRKARRGDIRTAALLLLAEQPRNGYQIMQEVQERSAGAWSPSPGSVYPALQQLEDEGLIRSSEHESRKSFVLTDAGRAVVAERDPDRPAPWEQMSDDAAGRAPELAKTMREVSFAFLEVMRTGSDSQMTQASKVLVSARRELYRILADGEDQQGAELDG